VSIDRATAPALARLRQARVPQEAVVRWLGLLAPLLLIGLVVAVFHAHPSPSPGLAGRRLVVSVAVVAFIVGVLGRNATASRLGPVHVGFVAVLLASSVALMWAQPDGPGAECVLVAVLCAARLLPVRVAVPLLVAGFAVVEVIAAEVTNQGAGNLGALAAFATIYGMLYLAFRLAEANRQAGQLLAELKESQAAQARATGLAERQRLAREMHDVLAHSLSGLMLQLEGARMLAAEDPGDPRLPQAIERAHQLGKTGLEEARRAIGMLRDDALPGPERLAGLAAQFQDDLGVRCRLTISGEAYELGSEARLAVYRVAQEALTNIAKHAHPQRVELQLAYEPSAIRLIVEDFTVPDGSRSPASGGDSSGYGLTGMRERAELLGGTLTATTTPSGFRVELEVPT
jgi:signal transduction histidine kinase